MEGVFGTRDAGKMRPALKLEIWVRNTTVWWLTPCPAWILVAFVVIPARTEMGNALGE
jgi:hypothetical protein